MLTYLLATHGHDAWGPGAWWPIFPLLFLGLWIGIAFVAFRRVGRRPWHHTAQDVLAERYARGEITVDEYQERLDVLRERRS